MAYLTRHYITRQVLIAACIDLGHLMVGYTMAWTAPVVPKLQNLQESPLPYTITVTEASWVASSYNIAVVFGPYVSGYLSNIIGRKLCIIIGSLLCFLAYIIIILAKSLATIILGRVVGALGIGIFAVVDLVYIGEIASPEIRGMILSSTGVFHSLGGLIMYSVGPYLSYVALGLLFLFINTIHLLGCFFIPESPVYYIMKDKKQSAKDILRTLRNQQDVEREMEGLIESVKKHEHNWQIRELFTVKSNRKVLFVTLALFILQENSGILAISSFATTIFKSAGSSITPHIATIIVGVTQFLTTLLAPMFIERGGRKLLLLISSSSCSICMVIMGTYFYMDKINHSTVANLRWLPLLIIVLYFCCYNMGLNIVPNTLVGEMYHTKVRSVGSTISMSLGWFTGFLSVTSFGYLVELLGSYVVFWVFALTNVVTFFFTLLVVPETKGMTLMEIQYMLAN